MKNILSWKLLQWLAYIGAFLLTMLASVADHPFLADVVISVALVLFVPVAILAIIQIAFWIHNAVRFGHPFYDEPQPYVKITQEVQVKKQKAWCILCRQFTGCHVRKNPHTGIMLHVIR